MKNLIKYLKLTGLFLGSILLLSFILGILNLIGLSSKITTIISVIFMVLMFLGFGFVEGLNANEKGYLAGLKIGLIFMFVMIIINLILFNSSFKISRIIYYLILIFGSVLGSTIGINRKKKD